jgi:hypothetical protein
MLQPGQLPRQNLILLPQLRQLPSHRHNLRIPHRDELIPLHRKPDQLITGHLLQRGHPKIKLQTRPSHHDRHARTVIPNTHLRARAECLHVGRATGTRDPHYVLVSMLYHALQAGETTMQYIHDAEQAGDQELAAFFRQVLDSDHARAEQAKKLLQGRLAQ